MRWLARLALTILVLAVWVAPGPNGPILSTPAMAGPADGGASEKSSSKSSKSEKSSSKSSKADKSSGKRGSESRAGKSAKGGKGGGRSGRGKSGSRGTTNADATNEPSEPQGPVADPTTAPVDPAPEVPVKVDDPVPAPVDPAPVEPEPEIPVKVDEPTPAPVEPAPEVPVNVDPTPAPVDPAPEVPVKVDDPVPAPIDPAPELPVNVDEPTPAPVDPAPEVPVKVDDPVPAPIDPAPEVPVKVDEPTPAPTPAPTPTPGPTPDPTVPVKVDEPVPADPGAPVAPEEPVVAETPPGPDIVDKKPNLQNLIGSILRGNRPRVTQGAGNSRPAPVAVTPTNRAPLAPPVALPPVAVVEAPAVDPALAPQVERAPEPVEAARAPRIALSSGGSGGASYRQHEISVLGLTPQSRQVVGALGFRILSERRSPLLGNRILAKLRTPANQTAAAAIERVRATLPELTVDFAHLYRPTGDQAPVRYPAEMVGAPAPGACRIDARIGLIDSGVGNHPSLARANVTRRNFVARDAATNVAHGTAIASILVGDLPGSGPLAPGAQVFSANVFAQDSAGLRADAHAIIEALDWMAAQRVPVVNLSLMGPPNTMLEQAVAAAASRGQVLVAAAGNDGPGAAPAYPAAYPAVIAVAALDARGRPYGRNNRGAYVYVSAPGVDVWGADARGGQAFWTGTSFAAPFVTATLARDVAQGRARNINDGRARIAASARDLGAPGRDPIYGYGLLQVGGCNGTGGAALSSKG